MGIALTADTKASLDRPNFAHLATLLKDGGKRSRIRHARCRPGIIARMPRNRGSAIEPRMSEATRLDDSKAICPTHAMTSSVNRAGLDRNVHRKAAAEIPKIRK